MRLAVLATLLIAGISAWGVDAAFAAPAGGSPAPAQAAPQPGGTPQSIPIPDASSPDPGQLEEEKQQAKSREERQYAALVLGAALIPIAGLLLWRFWPRSPTGVKRSKHRYAAGPADRRRIERRRRKK